MNIQKPKRVSLSAQIVQEMERLIRIGQWPVGERIPAEPEMMRLFGVSRNTVREALQSLIHAGLLAARPGDGTYVKGRTRMESILHRELSDASPAKVLEARLTLEIGIVGLAAKNRTADDLSSLRKALDERNRGDNPESDFEFHMTIARATHNPLLSDFYSEVCRYMLKNLVDKPLNGELYERDVELHNRLFDAISGGNENAAKEINLAIVRLYGDRIGLAPL